MNYQNLEREKSTKEESNKEIKKERTKVFKKKYYD